MNTRRGKADGLALIVVAGVLAILAVLATAFVTMAQLERRASRQWLNATKALLLARSGIEDALARLGAGQDPDLPSMRYWGEDWDADGSLSTYEAAQEVYHPTGTGTPADSEACPVRQAMRPGFFVRGTAGNPATQVVEGRQRGYTGALAGDLEAEGNHYAVRCLMEGGLHINGGDPSVPVVPSVPDYNLVLRRILGTLAEAIDREDGVPGDGPVSQADGFNLVDLRPGTGWKDWDQVRDVALGGSQGGLDALRPYLSLHALVDNKVIRPNAVPGMEGQGYQSWADIKLAHETYPLLPGTKEPDFERIPVLPEGRLVGRAPVSLAWARTRRPVLIALLAGLKGLYLDESTASPISGGNRIGTVLPAEIVLSWTSGTDDCRLAADLILASTSELGTWDAWDAFCDGIPFTGTSDHPQAKRDILKANFNPNSRLNKFGPNVSLWRSVDKSDLLAYSTEFSLLPQAEARELTCVGRILGREGCVLASRVLGVSLAPASLLTLTTQKEFVCGELGDPDMAGDEQSLRQPGQVPFISLSQGPGRTWGHALGQPGLDDMMGASLQTHPEPCVDTGSGLSTRAANYDGSVQLATVETPADYTYTVTSCVPNDMKLLARYTAGLDLDVSDAAPARPPGDPKWMNQPDLRQVTYNGGGAPDPSQLSYGLLHPTRPNTLYPDGAYSEKDRAPSYLDRDNANGLRGLLSFWIKSNHVPPMSSSYRGHPFLKWTNFSVGSATWDSSDQFFFLGDYGAIVTGGVDPIACQFEITHSSGDDLMEHFFRRDLGLAPHQWSLLTMYYDFQSLEEDDSGELRINAGLADGDKGSQDSYASGNAPIWATDITLPDKFGDHRLVLGEGRPGIEHNMTIHTGSGADATFDELAIYDFGGAGPGGIPAASDESKGSPGILAANRFKDGRYYKESIYAGLAASAGTNTAGEYFSPPIRLGGRCRIKALAWTQVVPRGLKAPFPGGQVGVDGDPGPDDGRILLELADASGGDYLNDASGKPINATFRDPASSPVGRTVDAPFRLHAVFQPNLADPDNTPILDPLALDDITVVYEPVGGRRIVSWEAS